MRPVGGVPSTKEPMWVPCKTNWVATEPPPVSPLLTISSDMSAKAAPHRFGEITNGFACQRVVHAEVVVGSAFGITAPRGVGIVPVPGICGALRNFKSIHGLYSCAKVSGERSRSPHAEVERPSGRPDRGRSRRNLTQQSEYPCRLSSMT